MDAQIPKFLVFGGSDQAWDCAAAVRPPLSSLPAAFLKGRCDEGEAACKHSLRHPTGTP